MKEMAIGRDAFKSQPVNTQFMGRFNILSKKGPDFGACNRKIVQMDEAIRL